MKIPKIINSLKAARTKNLKERKLERLNQNIRIHDKANDGCKRNNCELRTT